MTRKECYAFIKANPGIKEFFTVHKLNYTQLKTVELEANIINWNNLRNNIRNSSLEAKSAPAVNIVNPISPVDITTDGPMSKLCNILVEKKILLKREKDYILGI